LRITRLVHSDPPAIEPGEILLRVRRFALTANNITYATLGDTLGYWDFFPPADPGWGRIPVWGFGDVVASAHPSVAEGRQVFGYLPMATHLLLAPSRVNDRGLTDGADHRTALPPAYNAYRWLDTDPLYDPDHEDELLLFLPLFVLSFLLDAYLAEKEFFGAKNVILSSASSKASIGVARLLAARGIEVTALTSTRNTSFVDSLRLYTRTVTYDRVDDLPRQPAVFADLAGNAAIRRAVHARFGSDLVQSAVVGTTHWDTRPTTDDAPRWQPDWFFAPDHLRVLVARWGAAEFDRRFGRALWDFAAWSRDHMTIRRSVGPSAVESAYQYLLDGNTDPAVGTILAMIP